MLRNIAKNHAGCPHDFYDAEKVNDECYLWAKTLEEMAQGFEAFEALQRCSYFELCKENGIMSNKMNVEKQKALTAKYERGMVLFSEHFCSLWD